VNEITFTPFTPLDLPAARWRVALITTGGAYLNNGWHAPFNAPMPTFREFPANVEFETISMAVQSPYALDDGNVIFPLTPLHQLARQGFIKEVAPLHYSFAPDPGDVLALAGDTALSVAWRLKRATVNLALIVAVGGSEAVAATVARAVETVGVPTLVLGTSYDDLAGKGIPRAVVVEHPGMAPMGPPTNHARMQELLKELFDAAGQMPGAGSLWSLKYRWQG
jgi:D-proline reductase (dithiol) PrdB